MQFEDEGKPQRMLANETKFDLEDHLQKHGVTRLALLKMKDDDSGNMNANILTKCSRNELSSMCDDYGLSFLQKKAFTEAVKLLCNSDDNHNDDSPTRFIFVSPQERLNDVKTFSNSLQTFKTKQFVIKKNNKSSMHKNIQILKKNANKIKNTIDDIVGSIEKNFYHQSKMKKNNLICWKKR